MKYRSKPATVEAVLFDPESDSSESEVLAFLEGCTGWHMEGGDIVIPTNNGPAHVKPGHFIVKGISDFYPCDPVTFAARWEPADQPTAVRLFAIPPGTQRVKCEKCPAMIYFVMSANMKPMPLSTEPELKTKFGYVATAAKNPSSEEEGFGFSHFSNCPAAVTFRKGLAAIEVAIVLVILTIMAAIVFGDSGTYRAKRACLRHGFPNANGGGWGTTAYCVKRVNQTDSVVRLKELERK